MVKSMTGFGKAEAVATNKKIVVEIRSLNSKQLDLSVKLPALYRSLDPEVRSAVSKVLVRGKVDVFVNVESEAAMNTTAVNKELFAGYCRQLREACEANGMEWGTAEMNANVVQSILRLPDVVKNDAEDVSEEEKAALLGALGAALANIDNHRATEGKILIDDLLHRVDKIEAAKNEVTPFEKARTETVRKRIIDHIESLNIPLDSNRLEQEMIFYVEKLDITEEKVRLSNHCNYFREVAATEETPGRKLGFIGQEMGREINTMGSKANDANIQKIVVGMKDELEKIKEQLLNIL